MKLVLAFVGLSSIFANVAFGEQMATIYNPLQHPPANRRCNLFVNVVEYPQPGKYYLQYRITSSDKPVQLKLGKQNHKIAAGSDVRDGVTDAFTLAEVPDGGTIAVTFDGERHCEGSPFNLKQYVNKTAVKRFYLTALGREPKESEYIEWMQLEEVDRRTLTLRILNSPEGRVRIVDSYLEKYISDPVAAARIKQESQNGLPVEDMVAQIFGSPEYVQARSQGSHEGYLYALYSDVLGYAPSPEKHNMLLNYLLQGASPTAIAQYILREPAFLANMVQYWWYAHLNRQPKPREVQEALEALERGIGWNRLQAGLIASDEYFRRSVLVRQK